jgi:uncharacterized YigZ family protein
MTGGDEFFEPASFAEVETRRKRSIFTGRVFQAVSDEGARERIRDVSRRYADATHHCWAYRVGFPRTTEYYSDAGEPSGTAGKPILGAILRADVVNAVVVVTRYFGGTKLGVRGLIEAYGECAALALEAAGRRGRVRSRVAFVECPYEHAQLILRQLADLGLSEGAVEARWEAAVTLTAAVPLSLVDGAASLFENYEKRGFITRWEWK